VKFINEWLQPDEAVKREKMITEWANETENIIK